MKEIGSTVSGVSGQVKPPREGSVKLRSAQALFALCRK